MCLCVFLHSVVLCMYVAIWHVEKLGTEIMMS